MQSRSEAAQYKEIPVTGSATDGSELLGSRRRQNPNWRWNCVREARIDDRHIGYSFRPLPAARACTLSGVCDLGAGVDAVQCAEHIVNAWRQ